MALARFFWHPKLDAPKLDPVDGSYNYFGGDFKSWEIPQTEPGKFTSRQVFKAGSPHTGQGEKSTATPPYHYHYYQQEEFKVRSGVLCYRYEGRLGKLQPGQTFTIPIYKRHTFWSDPSTGEDLDVEITVSGGPHDGFSDDFVHNFYGYLSSVTMDGHKPNPLQMLRFLYSADVALADVPLCYYFAPAVNFVFGKLVGQYIAGYKERYKVFAVDSD